jgi:sulfatase modifying factor 1
MFILKFAIAFITVAGTFSFAGDHCDIGISVARRVGAGATAAEAQAKPGPTGGMVWIKGGEFWMGSEHAEMQDAKPIHRVALDGFWIDRTEVTNDEFAAFVAMTGYVTVAERQPDAKDSPDAKPDDLAPGAVVFSPPDHAVPLENALVWWRYVKGANWKHPEGPASDLKGRGDHPVVQVAWEDAAAYAKWAGKRLPTEAEFEFAARGGLDRQPYAWGSEFKPGGKFQANTFQGHFPDNNTAEDGYAGTAPVGSFPANGYGLYDMAGNVWEWCADWYRADYYEQLAQAEGVIHNPQGPQDSFDPDDPGVAKRVQKGGSFLCTDQYCTRYMPGSRGKGEPSTATNHAGFRCVISK